MFAILHALGMFVADDVDCAPALTAFLSEALRACACSKKYSVGKRFADEIAADEF
jgi:hypothetical protein